ncbi:site-2 protease family protein [Paradesulfitobacterium aromaticivorans]
MFNFDLPSLIANVPALLIGFAFHEFAHAWMADRLGDPTPRLTGRLTLNPVAHLDIFGTLMALFYRFGWAKPVLINPNNFRGNPLRSEMLVALAGPVMNLLIAFVSMLLWVMTLQWMYDTTWAPVVSEVFMAIVFMNLGLGIFNLLPIPPLDGFSVIGGFLPSRYAEQFWALKQYGMIILLLVLFTNVLGKILQPAVMFLFNLYRTIAILILSPFFR